MERTNDELALGVFKLIEHDPHNHTVPYLAEQLEVGPAQVAEILNDYGPDGNGGVEYRGEGQGGGWLTEDVAVQYRSQVEAPEFLGHRWPDGELRDDPFDIDNPEHKEWLQGFAASLNE